MQNKLFCMCESRASWRAASQTAREHPLTCTAANLLTNFGTYSAQDVRRAGLAADANRQHAPTSADATLVQAER
jgi:hypothetical protein